MSRSTKKTAIVLAVWAAFFLLLAAAPAYAALPTLVPTCARTGTDVPSFNCLLQTFGNIALLILGLTGSAALLMFVYGGFMYIWGGVGGKDSVEKAKTIIKNAVIGIIIIMTSGILLQYGLTQLKIETMSIGQSCKGNGQVVELPDGSLQCVTGCNEIPGFDCMDAAGRTNCIAGLCSGNEDKMCCQK